MLAAVVLLSLTALFLLCLSLPLELAIRLDFGEKAGLTLRVLWLFGMVKRELRRECASVIAGLLQGGGPPWGVARALTGVWRAQELRERSLRLLKNCSRALKLKRLVARLKVGLDSPADTGLLLAYLSPLGLVGLFPGYDIEIEPSFEDGAVVQGYLSAVVGIKPLQVLVAALTFLFSLPAIRAIAGSLRKRWRGKSRRKRLCPSAA